MATLTLFLFVVAAIHGIHSASMCEMEPCDKESGPVCGICDEGGDVKTFENMCELEEENESSSGNWKLLHKGECEGSDYCGRECPPSFAPVCATDGKEFRIFASECEVEMYNNCTDPDKPFELTILSNCKKDSDGSSDEKNHPTGCPTVIEPVCGVNGEGCKTFKNRCELDKYNSCHDSKYKYAYDGECQETEA